jgi:hypothetical protein
LWRQVTELETACSLSDMRISDQFLRRSMVLLGVARASTSVGVVPEAFLLLQGILCQQVVDYKLSVLTASRSASFVQLLKIDLLKEALHSATIRLRFRISAVWCDQSLASGRLKCEVLELQ